MKNIKKSKIITLILLTILMLSISNIVYGIDTDKFNPPELTTSDMGYANELGSTIIGAITAVGAIVAVIGLLGIGIKFMVGSVEERAEYKKSLTPYLIGCIMIFGIIGILNIIYQLVVSANG